MEKTKKKHWTQKLKEENEKLTVDLYKILDGDFMTTLCYKTLRQAAIDFEKIVWAGNPATTKTKAKKEFNALCKRKSK
jgi:hypothetical protein